ncbi:hypothetical protein LSCM1_00272 [Leishmania martiniquensis]|uniref:Cyclin-e binding protein 1-like protein n=1 Tax=Leishmania martiniquensis TaxID=1580590 RepID=A0A836K9P6_9TRYP|nr:hypothetical protein LSCM1_00272 [Leishmania martiniquensis]
MFSVIPTAAAVPTEAGLLSLAGSAESVVDALRPFLDKPTLPDSPPLPPFTIEKVASCKAFYSALLRSDGALLLLSNPAAHGAESRACVSVLESGEEAVIDVAAGASHIVYCTVSGAVYSCGFDNTYGQLGDGSVWSSGDATDCPAEGQTAQGGGVPVLSAPKRVAGFGEGAVADGEHGDHISVEDIDAALASAADCRAAMGLAPLPSSLALCSRSSTVGATWRRVPRSADRHIAQVACGAHHTLLLTQSGRCVYACGTGERGQLGGSRPVLVQPAFRAIPLLFGMEMAQVAAADAHSFVLLRNGLLYAFGDNTCGQLGLGHTKRVTRPTRVPLTDEEGREACGAQDLPAATTKGVWHLDAKAYATLRAPYASKESTYYPLRVPRLQADVKPHAITSGGGRDGGSAFVAPTKCDCHNHELDASSSSVRVVRVHCCLSWTLLETSNPGVWLSCGTPLTRGVDQTFLTTSTARIDGCGVLGRSLLRNKAEAYAFQPVQWGATLCSVRRSADATTAALAAAPTRGGEVQRRLRTGPLDRATEGMSHPQQLLSTSTNQHTTCGTPGGDSPLCISAATTASVAGHRSAAGSHISGTVPSSSQAAIVTEKAILHVRDTPVSAYPTSLLIALWSATAGDADRDGVATSMLIQNGSPVVVALEVRAGSSPALRTVTGSPASGSIDEQLSGVPSGASTLQVYSIHGAVIPLPSYVLVM